MEVLHVFKIKPTANDRMAQLHRFAFLRSDGRWFEFLCPYEIARRKDELDLWSREVNKTILAHPSIN